MAVERLTIRWRAPWHAASPDFAEKAQAELAREMPAGHLLFGRRATAVGVRDDCDDVLFYLGESAPQFAVVHLTYQKERKPEWPPTELFESIDDWVNWRMLPDAMEFE